MSWFRRRLGFERVLGVGLLAVSACRAPAPEGPRVIQPKYDEQTGKLKQLQYDADRNGKVDTISYMDGARILRIEIDKDEDGKVDRWEHYGADQKLEKVGVSRSGDGIEDAWSYAGPDRQIVRIEISTRRDGRISRIEHYQGEQLSSAEEDTDADRAIDRWETFDSGRLTMVSFDSTHRGKPDRRLVYAADGSVRVEIDPSGAGNWTAERR